MDLGVCYLQTNPVTCLLTWYATGIPLLRLNYIELPPEWQSQESWESWYFRNQPHSETSVLQPKNVSLCFLSNLPSRHHSLMSVQPNAIVQNVQYQGRTFGDWKRLHGQDSKPMQNQPPPLLNLRVFSYLQMSYHMSYMSYVICHPFHPILVWWPSVLPLRSPSVLWWPSH